MRSIGLDVHRDFCEVAISDGGKARSAGKISTTPEEIELFARSLAPDDRVVMEAVSNALAILRIIEPHVGEVVLAHPKQLRAISHAKVKSDKVDARMLAELLSADLIPRVWAGDEQTRVLRRRISRRRLLVKQRIAVKNAISAITIRNLKTRPAVSDLFGKVGRAWLETLDLPEDERETLVASLRQLDFLSEELALVDQAIAQVALGSEEIRRLMTIPGVDVTTAATLIAVIGDISRFPTPKHLVGYLGLHPRSRQSGSTPARHGRISKEGSAAARHVLVEAAWAAVRAPGPLRAFALRVAARRGRNVAAVAVARKLTVLCWHLLTRDEDYAFARPTLVRRKLRDLELATGASQLKRGPNKNPIQPTAARAREREIVEQAEAAYLRLVADWRASGPKKKGAGTTLGRASSRPPGRQAARQTSKPERSTL